MQYTDSGAKAAASRARNALKRVQEYANSDPSRASEHAIVLLKEVALAVEGLAKVVETQEGYMNNLATHIPAIGAVKELKRK